MGFLAAQEAIKQRPGASIVMLASVAVLAGVVLGVGVAAVGPLYLVAALIALGLGTAFLRNTLFGVLCFVGIATLLPFAVIPVPLGAFKLTLIDVTLTLLLLMWVVRLLVVPAAGLQVGRVGGLVAVFLLLAFVSFISGTAYSISPEATRLFLKIINSILFFFTIVNCVRTRRHVEQVVAGLIVFGAVASAIAIVLYFLPAEITTRLLSALRPLEYPSGPNVLRYIAGTKTLRATATSIDPNILGATLMICASLSFSQLISRVPVIPRWITIATSSTLAIALLLTFSRSSWMGLISGLLFVASFRYRKLWALFVLLAIALYVGLVPRDIPFVSHLESGLQARDQAAAMRLGEYKDALRLISSYPWFGVGFGGAPSADLYVGVSSIYLLMAEQMGLIGSSVFLLTVGMLLFGALRQVNRASDTRGQDLLLGLIAALVTALTAGVFDHHFFNLRFPHTVALFWLIAGLLSTATRLAVPQEET